MNELFTNTTYIGTCLAAGAEKTSKNQKIFQKSVKKTFKKMVKKSVKKFFFKHLSKNLLKNRSKNLSKILSSKSLFKNWSDPSFSCQKILKNKYGCERSLCLDPAKQNLRHEKVALSATYRKTYIFQFILKIFCWSWQE